ncbi:altronate dehydratase family protein [Acidiferrimicrobium sp. IK]|nr:altronate dehydratase family protein [Acidiferrimicrobium sp. IK]MCU4186884.1 altronate dehydratase family protein [Acidiferrimicrobium sp. IK]
MTATPLDRVAIRLHPDDDVAVARSEVLAGTEIDDGSRTFAAGSDVPAGHKIAVRAVAAGGPVRKYGQRIGVATSPIAAGDHVHTHNLAVGPPAAHTTGPAGETGVPSADGPAPVGTASRAATSSGTSPPATTFAGIVRPDGRIATRNYIGILTSVNCSATAARLIADRFRPGSDLLAQHPDVDGVVALTHGSGCGMAVSGDGLSLLRRTITGYARHPNFAGLLVLGLGCEVNQVDSLAEGFDLPPSTPVHTMTIQALGGTRATVDEGVARIREMVGAAAEVRRRPVPVSELVLGLNCGGSDAYSGITANPALGVAADLLIAQGGTAVLGETPEIHGAEHLLTGRADPAVAEALLERVRWWESYVEASGGSLDNNPSPGNKAGGLTTILEKSLGAVAKAGTSRLQQVVGYAERPTRRGLVFMDTPGYDPVSVTGIVAGGANVVCFTTGRGSVFGCKPAPSLKLATNSEVYRRMPDDMDINCGSILDGDETVEQAGRRIFDAVVAVASGRRTLSEELGVGDNEFVPWQLGAVL